MGKKRKNKRMRKRPEETRIIPERALTCTNRRDTGCLPN